VGGAHGFFPGFFFFFFLFPPPPPHPELTHVYIGVYIYG